MTRNMKIVNSHDMLHQRMDEEGANRVTFDQNNHENCQDDTLLLALLKICAKYKDVSEGNKLHADVLKKGFLDINTLICNTLVHMYSACGAFSKARQLFNELPGQSVVSWNALVAGYAQYGHAEEALGCFEQMQVDGISPNAVTLACVVKACGKIGAAKKGNKLHLEIVRKGFLGKDVVLSGSLVDMYAKCGVLDKAQQVFDELPIRNVISWTALITGYCQHGQDEGALMCYKKMRKEGLSPDAVTLACILKACGSTGEALEGEEIHTEIARLGLLEGDTVLGSALVDMYAKCGALAKAHEVFNELPVRSVVPWSALIAGYSENGQGEEALYCYDQMKDEGLSPDAVTFACILRACGLVGAAEMGNELHAEIIRMGLLGDKSVLGNVLLDMYAKCGALTDAQRVFDELAGQDVVSWTALISGYCQHGRAKEALNCFDRKKREGLSPNMVTFHCVLKACGSLGAVEKGEEVHIEIVRKGLLGHNALLGTALVDMYAKCGVIAKAHKVCNELPARDIVSWSVLIGGYCEHGRAEEAFTCLERMKKEGFTPDALTLTFVLKACSTIGAAERGQSYFETMSASYGIIPSLEHCTCMVDLFCRAGLFDTAMAVFKKMPSSHYLPAWCALMGACQKWGNVKMGSLVFDHAARLAEASVV